MAIGLSRQNPAAVGPRYRPSIRTILLVRFDAGTKDTGSAADVRVEDEPDAAQTARLAPLISAFGGDATSAGMVLDGTARGAALAANVDLSSALSRMDLSDSLSRFIDVRPLESNRTANSFRQADELTLKLAWKDFPFDARAVRAVLALHFEGTVTPSQFAIGFSSAEPPVLPATRRNLRFVGLADSVSDSHSEGTDLVTMKFRDLTAALIDTKKPANLQVVIRPDTTLLAAVRALLDSLRGSVADLIRGPFLRPVDTDLPRLNRKRYPKLATTARSRNKAGTGGEPQVVRRGSKSGGDETYWDAITDLCVSHGFVPYIERDALILQPPRTLYTGRPEVVGQTGQARFPTPERAQIGDVAHVVRRMVYGANITDLAFDRKLGRVKAPRVRVTSYNPDAPDASRRLVSVTHPAGKRPTKVAPSGKGKTVEVHNVIVQGVTDETLLRAVAEAAYEAMGRQEVGVSFGTSDLSSFSDHPQHDPNQDPDLLDLQSGDPIRLLVTPTERRTGALFSITELSAMVSRARGAAGGGKPEFADAIVYLRAQGFRQKDAEQLVRVLNSRQLPSEFRVSGATFRFDMEGGNVSVRVTMRDYIRVRADPEDVTVTGGVGRAVDGGVVA